MPKRLLLVDDEPRNLALLEAYLAPLGHELTRAADGAAALALIDRETPDLVLLDVAMPGLDGIDVLTHLRAKTAPHVPVILVTGHTEREDRLRGFEAGADDFLEKPVDRAMLLTRVRTLLRLKEANDEIVQRNELLERMQREQRELTAFIVHDLKSPLAVLHMNLQWVRESIEATPVIHEALDDAQEASSRLQKMVEDLLVVARLEQSELPLRRERVPLRDVLPEILRAHAREAESRRITLGSDVNDGLDVAADPQILRRIIENLLDNALRHTPEQGRVSISARRREGVDIAVSNTGRAIADDEQKRIFDKFRRGAGVAARGGHVGLGLYFCKRAIEAHGGTITLVRTPEFPTSFVVHLAAA